MSTRSVVSLGLEAGRSNARGREPSCDALAVGDRVVVRTDGLGRGGNCPVNAKGVVRFIGPTSFASGRWYGVELDDAVGKHDGEVKGIPYFQCEPNRGLFTRSSSLMKLDEDDRPPHQHLAPPYCSGSPKVVVSDFATAGLKSYPSSPAALKEYNPQSQLARVEAYALSFAEPSLSRAWTTRSRGIRSPLRPRRPSPSRGPRGPFVAPPRVGVSVRSEDYSSSYRSNSEDAERLSSDEMGATVSPDLRIDLVTATSSLADPFSESIASSILPSSPAAQDRAERRMQEVAEELFTRLPEWARATSELGIRVGQLDSRVAILAGLEARLHDQRERIPELVRSQIESGLSRSFDDRAKLYAQSFDAVRSRIDNLSDRQAELQIQINELAQSQRDLARGFAESLSGPASRALEHLRDDLNNKLDHAMVGLHDRLEDVFGQWSIAESKVRFANTERHAVPETNITALLGMSDDAESLECGFFEEGAAKLLGFKGTLAALVEHSNVIKRRLDALEKGGGPAKQDGSPETFIEPLVREPFNANPSISVLEEIVHGHSVRLEELSNLIGSEDVAAISRMAIAKTVEVEASVIALSNWEGSFRQRCELAAESELQSGHLEAVQVVSDLRERFAKLAEQNEFIQFNTTEALARAVDIDARVAVLVGMEDIMRAHCERCGESEMQGSDPTHQVLEMAVGRIETSHRDLRQRLEDIGTMHSELAHTVGEMELNSSSLDSRSRSLAWGDVGLVNLRVVDLETSEIFSQISDRLQNLMDKHGNLEYKVAEVFEKHVDIDSRLVALAALEDDERRDITLSCLERKHCELGACQARLEVGHEELEARINELCGKHAEGESGCLRFACLADIVQNHSTEFEELKRGQEASIETSRCLEDSLQMLLGRAQDAIEARFGDGRVLDKILTFVGVEDALQYHSKRIEELERRSVNETHSYYSHTELAEHFAVLAGLRSDLACGVVDIEGRASEVHGCIAEVRNLQETVGGYDRRLVGSIRGIADLKPILEECVRQYSDLDRRFVETSEEYVELGTHVFALRTLEERFDELHDFCNELVEQRTSRKSLECSNPLGPSSGRVAQYASCEVNIQDRIPGLACASGGISKHSSDVDQVQDSNEHVEAMFKNDVDCFAGEQYREANRACDAIGTTVCVDLARLELTLQTHAERIRDLQSFCDDIAKHNLDSAFPIALEELSTTSDRVDALAGFEESVEHTIQLFKRSSEASNALSIMPQVKELVTRVEIDLRNDMGRLVREQAEMGINSRADSLRGVEDTLQNHCKAIEDLESLREGLVEHHAKEVSSAASEEIEAIGARVDAFATFKGGIEATVQELVERNTESSDGLSKLQQVVFSFEEALQFCREENERLYSDHSLHEVVDRICSIDARVDSFSSFEEKIEESVCCLSNQFGDAFEESRSLNEVEQSSSSALKDLERMVVEHPALTLKVDDAIVKTNRLEWTVQTACQGIEDLRSLCAKFAELHNRGAVEETKEQIESLSAHVDTLVEQQQTSEGLMRFRHQRLEESSLEQNRVQISMENAMSALEAGLRNTEERLTHVERMEAALTEFSLRQRELESGQREFDVRIEALTRVPTAELVLGQETAMGASVCLEGEMLALLEKAKVAVEARLDGLLAQKLSGDLISLGGLEDSLRDYAETLTQFRCHEASHEETRLSQAELKMEHVKLEARVDAVSGAYTELRSALADATQRVTDISECQAGAVDLERGAQRLSEVAIAELRADLDRLAAQHSHIASKTDVALAMETDISSCVTALSGLEGTIYEHFDPVAISARASAFDGVADTVQKLRISVEELEHGQEAFLDTSLCLEGGIQALLGRAELDVEERFKDLAGNRFSAKMTSLCGLENVVRDHTQRFTQLERIEASLTSFEGSMETAIQHLVNTHNESSEAFGKLQQAVGGCEDIPPSYRANLENVHTDRALHEAFERISSIDARLESYSSFEGKIEESVGGALGDFGRALRFHTEKLSQLDLGQEALVEASWCLEDGMQTLLGRVEVGVQDRLNELAGKHLSAKMIAFGGLEDTCRDHTTRLAELERIEASQRKSQLRVDAHASQNVVDVVETILTIDKRVVALEELKCFSNNAGVELNITSDGRTEDSFEFLDSKLVELKHTVQNHSRGLEELEERQQASIDVSLCLEDGLQLVLARSQAYMQGRMEDLTGKQSAEQELEIRFNRLAERHEALSSGQLSDRPYSQLASRIDRMDSLYAALLQELHLNEEELMARPLEDHAVEQAPLRGERRSPLPRNSFSDSSQVVSQEASQRLSESPFDVVPVDTS